VVKVLDFGLAKSMKALDAAERALTRTTAVMGSPAYMSPEQMRALREVDGGTDIWSLGVCLYELLTRVTPFDAPTVAELHALVLMATPRPPETLRPDLPPQLATTILRCLEKDRSRRFRDIGELAHALRDFSGSGRHAAAHARDARSSDTKTEVSVGPRVERSRTAPIVAAILAMLVLGGIGVVMGGRALRRAAVAARPTGSVTAEPAAPGESVSGAAIATPSEASAAPAASDARPPVVGVATARSGGGTGAGARGGSARASTTKATASPSAKPAPSADPPPVPTSRPITTAF